MKVANARICHWGWIIQVVILGRHFALQDSDGCIVLSQHGRNFVHALWSKRLRYRKPKPPIHSMTSFELLWDALAEYEHERTRDLLLFPWHMCRWTFWWLVTQAWGWWRVLRHGNRVWSFMWGRHNSPEPVLCRYCLWGGAQRECYHGYSAVGDDDCEPQDSCPRCDGDFF